MKDVVQFFQEVRIELTKATWPKFNEFIGSTIVVLFLMCVFAVYLGLIDLGLTKMAQYVFERYGLYY